MREIKFRFWDGKQMYDWSWANEYQIEHVFNPDMEIWEVMQYTGLKDKNGVEIYEGDIISGYSFPSIVVMDIHLGTGTRMKAGAWNGKITTWLDNSSEVIGNIWENLDLLK